MDTKRSVLVIGGAGYIGSHVVKHLAQTGYQPIILDDLSTGHRAATRGLLFYEGSSQDSALVEKIISNHDVKSVMYFAARAIVPESIEKPLLYYRENVAHTVELLSTLVKKDVERFVFSSTCATFGESSKIPIGESQPQNPTNPYGRSKKMVEEILSDCSKTYGLKATVLRYFNAAGADPDGELGEDHAHETHIIPLLLHTALGRRKEFTLYGNDYPTADGTCIRDYVHVNDLAVGHVNALELTGDAYQDFNLGCGNGFSNLEVLRMVEEVTGKKINHRFGPRRPGDPPVLIADATKAVNLLNWAPRYSLREMVETAYRFMQKFPEGYPN